jgi:hypothetical protein
MHRSGSELTPEDAIAEDVRRLLLRTHQQYAAEIASLKSQLADERLKVEELQQQLEETRSERRAAEALHKVTISRLRAELSLAIAQRGPRSPAGAAVSTPPSSVSHSIPAPEPPCLPSEGASSGPSLPLAATSTSSSLSIAPTAPTTAQAGQPATGNDAAPVIDENDPLSVVLGRMNPEERRIWLGGARDGGKGQVDHRAKGKG